MRLIKYSWWYITDPKTSQKKPVICACLILEDVEEDLDRGGIGISICSDSDNPFSKKGRGLAYARASHACNSDLPGLPVTRQEALRVILKTSLPEVVSWKSLPYGTSDYSRLKKSLFPLRNPDWEEEHA